MFNSGISGLSEAVLEAFEMMVQKGRGLLGPSVVVQELILGERGAKSGFRFRIPEILTTGPQKETHLFESDFIYLCFAFFL